MMKQVTFWGVQINVEGIIKKSITAKSWEAKEFVWAAARCGYL